MLMITETGIRGFARRKGVHPAAVEKAVKNGRLELSVRRDARGRPRISLAVGDEEWERNRDPSKDNNNDNRAKPRGKRRGTRVPLTDLNPPVAAVYLVRAMFE